MTKTLLISDVFPPETGGSGRWFWEIYQRLNRDIVVVTDNAVSSTNIDELAPFQIERYPLKMNDWGTLNLAGLQHYSANLRRLSRTIRDHDIAEIHAGKCLPEGWLAMLTAKFYRLPFLCFVHGEEVEYCLLSRQYRWMAKQVFRSAKLIIANSENSKSLLVEKVGLPESKIAVLHPGVDTQQYRPAVVDRNFCHEVGWIGKSVILTVGRLQKRKGHDHLIEALPKILETVPNALYAIVGNGEELHPLQEKVRSLGLDNVVQFYTSATDEMLVRLYQNCTVFVLPNRTVGADIEGFGIVLLEAQACGKPVIAGDSGGTRETMLVGESGLIVDCDDVDSLAAAISGLLQAPEEIDRMSTVGREWVVKSFDWGNLAGRAEDTFARLNSHVALSR